VVLVQLEAVKAKAEVDSATAKQEVEQAMQALKVAQDEAAATKLATEKAQEEAQTQMQALEEEEARRGEWRNRRSAQRALRPSKAAEDALEEGRRRKEEEEEKQHAAFDKTWGELELKGGLLRIWPLCPFFPNWSPSSALRSVVQ
jgi:hypothetical protein